MPKQIPAPILLVNDRSADLQALEAVLEPLGEPIHRASSAAEGQAIADREPLALAVIDLRMPGTDGITLATELRQHPPTRRLPILFVSAHEPEPAVLRRIFTMDAADFVALPAAPEALRARARVFADLYRQRLLASEKLQTLAGESGHAREDRLRLLADTESDYAFFFTDEKGIVTEWTVSARLLLGYEPSEVVGRHYEFVFTGHDRAAGAPAREMESAVRDGQARDERMHVRKGSATFPATGRLLALRAPDGRLRGFAKIMRDATALRTLEESERKYREIFEAAQEGIWILDGEARIVAANGRMAELIGYAVPDLIGRGKTDFIYPNDVPRVRALFEQRRRGQVLTSVEVRFRHRDGHPIWTLMSARPILRDGQFAGALDMFTDITERRGAEERFRLFFESSAAGHVLLDPDQGRFLSVNRRYCQIVGRSAEELSRLTPEQITHPDDRAANAEATARLYRGAASEVSLEKRYLRPDGSTVWVHLTSTLVRTAEGRPELRLSVVQDITDRRQSQQALLDQQVRLQLAVKATDLGLLYRENEAGHYVWNDQAKRLLGLPADSSPSFAGFLEHVHPGDRSRIDAEVRHLLADPAPASRDFRLDFRVLAPDGGIRHLVMRGLVQARNGDAARAREFIATLQDVTAVKEFEAELRIRVAERTRELEEKAAQLENFCYTVAHDLRAPLRSINGHAELVMELLNPQGQARDSLQRITISSQRLDRLINDLLSYSRVAIVTVDTEPVDLDAALADVMSDLAGDIERLRAQVHIRRPLPRVLGERGMIEQVLTNLLSNALKFTRDGEPPRIEVFADKIGPGVRLSIRDQGIGIPPEHHERIFRVFERLQTSNRIPGTGVGLAVVARAIDRLGGRYGVESTPGQGSTFWIELPEAPS